VECRQRLQQSGSRFAVEHDLTVLRRCGRRLTGQYGVLGDQGGPRDRHDRVFGRFSDIYGLRAFGFLRGVSIG